MKTIGILNGPNLNRLGKREPALYGNLSLQDLESQLSVLAEELGVHVECYQSNHEGVLIDKLTTWEDAGIRDVVFNPGAYTHTSVALRDALAGSHLRVIEVHISNIYQREVFRHQSLTAPVVEGVVSGLGFDGYALSLRYLAAK